MGYEHREFISVPESTPTEMKVSFPGMQVWDKLIDEAVYRDVNQYDLGAAIINLNVKITGLSDNEYMMLRDSEGNETTLDIMDPKFAPIAPEFESPIVTPREMAMVIFSDHKDKVMEYANRNHLSEEQLGIRFFNLGCYVARQTRDGAATVHHVKDGIASDYSFFIRGPREKIQTYIDDLNKKEQAA